MKLVLPRVICVVICFSPLLCCGHKEEPKVQAPGPVKFSEAFIEEVIPTAEGGAYLSTADAGLWYVHGPIAEKVVFPGDTTEKEDEPGGLHVEITPTVEGGAYGTSSSKGLWYLHGASAVRVTEGKLTLSQGSLSRNSSFALFVAELRKRRAAERRAEGDIGAGDQTYPDETP